MPDTAVDVRDKIYVDGSWIPSTGKGTIIRPGDVQRMTAGSGIHHSEENASRTDAVHFLQIWILPDTMRLTPGSYANLGPQWTKHAGSFMCVQP